MSRNELNAVTGSSGFCFRLGGDLAGGVGVYIGAGLGPGTIRRSARNIMM